MRGKGKRIEKPWVGVYGFVKYKEPLSGLARAFALLALFFYLVAFLLG